MEAFKKENPFKILMTTDTVGGVWTYALELCAALHKYEVQIFLVTMGAPLKVQQKAAVAALDRVTVFETAYLLEWMDAPWNDIDASGTYLLELEKELQPDLIHLNAYSYGSLPWKTPVIAVAHSDVFSWWQAVKGEVPPVEWNEYYYRVKNGLSGADLVIAPSQAMLQFIKDIYAPKVAYKVIYNGRNEALFQRGNKEPYIFSMGRTWDEAKNIKLLLDAAPLVINTIKIAGDNNFSNHHINMTAKNVDYLGFLNAQQVAAQLAHATIFVLPARYEPFGLSPLEAALSGCALVLGNIQSLKEIWQENAFYVDTEDAFALADAINNLIKDKALLTEYADKAYQRALNFSSVKMADAYMQVYRQLVQQHQQNLKTAIT